MDDSCYNHYVAVSTRDNPSQFVRIGSSCLLVGVDFSHSHSVAPDMCKSLLSDGMRCCCRLRGYTLEDYPVFPASDWPTQHLEVQ